MFFFPGQSFFKVGTDNVTTTFVPHLGGVLLYMPPAFSFPTGFFKDGGWVNIFDSYDVDKIWFFVVVFDRRNSCYATCYHFAYCWIILYDFCLF